MTLKDRCEKLNITIDELTEQSDTSRETLRNWLNNNPKRFTAVLNGIYFKRILNNLSKTLDSDK